MKNDLSKMAVLISRILDIRDYAFGTLKEVEAVVEEMTVEQICKALGKNVKIIK
jgi:hypothetical protein